MNFRLKSWRLAGAAGAAFLGVMALGSAPAQAWWRGGVWIGGPVVVGAPVVPYAYPYYYPPAYYPPAYYPYPPYYYGAPAATPVPQAQSQTRTQSQTTTTQTTASAVPYGSTCYAGVYVCAAPGATPVGAGCSCPGIGAPSYGSVH